MPPASLRARCRLTPAAISNAQLNNADDNTRPTASHVAKRVVAALAAPAGAWRSANATTRATCTASYAVWQRVACACRARRHGPHTRTPPASQAATQTPINKPTLTPRQTQQHRLLVATAGVGVRYDQGWASPTHSRTQKAGTHAAAMLRRSCAAACMHASSCVCRQLC